MTELLLGMLLLNEYRLLKIQTSLWNLHFLFWLLFLSRAPRFWHSCKGHELKQLKPNEINLVKWATDIFHLFFLKAQITLPGHIASQKSTHISKYREIVPLDYWFEIPVEFCRTYYLILAPMNYFEPNFLAFEFNCY